MDQPSLIANPARGQLNRENVFSLSPSAPENLAWGDRFDRPVPRQLSHSHTQTESGAYSRVPLFPPEFRDGRRPSIPPYTPSCQSRVYRVTQLRTDDVHRGESVGTGPVALNPPPLPDGRRLLSPLWVLQVLRTSRSLRVKGRSTPERSRRRTAQFSAHVAHMSYI